MKRREDPFCVPSPFSACRRLSLSPLARVALLLLAVAAPSAGQSAIASVSAAAPATADEATSPPVPEPAELPTFGERLVVTATASSRPERELPYTVRLVDGESLRRSRLPRDLSAALEGLPGLSIQRTSAGHGSPFLRGLTGFRTLYLVDGVRVNNSTWREGPNQYASQLDALGNDRIEVLSGAGAVLYGTDAVGGTMQLVPTSLEPVRLDGRPVSGNLWLRGASGENTFGGRAEVAGALGERFAFRASAQQDDHGDLESGGITLPHAGYGSRASDFRGEWRVGEGRALLVAFQQGALDDVWRTHSTRDAVPYAGTTVGTDARRASDLARRLAYARWSDRRGGALADRWEITTSWQTQDESEDRIRANGERGLQELAVGTAGLQFHADKQLGRHDLGFGFEGYRDRVDSSGRTFTAAGALKKVEIQGPVADDATYDLLGAWVQDRLAWERTRAVLGIRFTQARIDAARALDPTTGAAMAVRDRWSHTVGEARLLRDLDGHGRWQLIGGLSQAFRAPNLSDLTRYDSARSGEREIPSPGLEPENYLTSEIGLRGQGDVWRADLTLFRTWIRDLIVRTPTGRMRGTEVEVIKTNAGSGRLDGAELSIEGQVTRRLAVGVSASWLTGDVEVPRSPLGGTVVEPIDKLPPAAVRLSAEWREPRDRWALGGAIRLVARQDRLSSADRADVQRIPPGGTPGYTVVDLTGRFRIARRLAVACRVENATDRTYRVHGSGVNEPGRNVVISTDLSF